MKVLLPLPLIPRFSEKVPNSMEVSDTTASLNLPTAPSQSRLQNERLLRHAIAQVSYSELLRSAYRMKNQQRCLVQSPK